MVKIIGVFDNFEENLDEYKKTLINDLIKLGIRQDNISLISNKKLTDKNNSKFAKFSNYMGLKSNLPIKVFYGAFFGTIIGFLVFLGFLLMIPQLFKLITNESYNMLFACGIMGCSMGLTIGTIICLPNIQKTKGNLLAIVKTEKRNIKEIKYIFQKYKVSKIQHIN